MNLYYPKRCREFIRQFPDEFKNYGCGPGGIGDYFVPDTVYGLSIREACRIHDWCYRHANEASEKNRKQHDVLLKENATRIVFSRGGWNLIVRLRLRRVKIYYKMVRAFGGPAYWSERS